MRSIGRLRRFACALIALGTATILLRSQLADALVTRGDDAFRMGDAAAAIHAYERALTLDAKSDVAADRLSFQLAMLHQPNAARRAVAVATTALAVAPNAALLVDRGLGELQLGGYARAARDFAAAGAMNHDARYEHLAARAALRSGDRRAAWLYERRAIAVDPAFRPAHALLRMFE